MEYEDYLFVPKERLGVLIGGSGAVKKKLEARTGVSIRVDSETGEVTIERTEENADAALKAREVVQAIARGFSPGKAFELLRDDVFLRVIDLTDIAKSDKAVARQRARIIGAEGKARQLLEQYTETDISVLGKTVAIIGGLEDVEIAVEAIEMLARGVPHNDVYRHIRKKRIGA